MMPPFMETSCHYDIWLSMCSMLFLLSAKGKAAENTSALRARHFSTLVVSIKPLIAPIVPYWYESCDCQIFPAKPVYCLNANPDTAWPLRLREVSAGIINGTSIKTGTS